MDDETKQVYKEALAADEAMDALEMMHRPVNAGLGGPKCMHDTYPWPCPTAQVVQKFRATTEDGA